VRDQVKLGTVSLPDLGTKGRYFACMRGNAGENKFIIVKLIKKVVNKFFISSKNKLGKQDNEHYKCIFYFQIFW
jgi:hypothetical protein